jgi:hypothetical protein
VPNLIRQSNPAGPAVNTVMRAAGYLAPATVKLAIAFTTGAGLTAAREGAAPDAGKVANATAGAIGAVYGGQTLTGFLNSRIGLHVGLSTARGLAGAGVSIAAGTAGGIAGVLALSGLAVAAQALKSAGAARQQALAGLIDQHGISLAAHLIAQTPSDAAHLVRPVTEDMRAIARGKGQLGELGAQLNKLRATGRPGAAAEIESLRARIGEVSAAILDAALAQVIRTAKDTPVARPEVALDRTVRILDRLTDHAQALDAAGRGVSRDIERTGRAATNDAIVAALTSPAQPTARRTHPAPS